MRTEVDKLDTPSESHGARQPGEGVVSGAITRSLFDIVALPFVWRG